MIHTHITDKDNCGIIFPIPGKGGEGITAYSAGALDEGDVVWLDYSQTAGREVTANTPATKTFDVKTAVAMADVGAGKIGKFQISGKAKVKCGNGSDAITAGKFLEVINGTKYAIEDGAARTTVSIGVLVDAVAATDSAALKDVILIPEQHTIAGS